MNQETSLTETLRNLHPLRSIVNDMKDFHPLRAFIESAQEFKDPRSVVGTALLIALSVILSITLSIRLSPTLRIQFSFLAFSILGMLYGPAMGAAAGVISDIVGYILFPTGAFFPGYTLNAALGGVFYGLFLYRGHAGLVRCILAKGLVNIVINIGLGTLWASMMSGKGFWLLLATRGPKNLILLPIEVIMMLVVLNFVKQILPPQLIKKGTFVHRKQGKKE